MLPPCAHRAKRCAVLPACGTAQGNKTTHIGYSGLESGETTVWGAGGNGGVGRVVIVTGCSAQHRMRRLGGRALAAEPSGAKSLLLPGGKGKRMENKSSLEIVEICLRENGGTILAAGCGMDQHTDSCCQPRTRGSQPNSVPWKNGIGVSCASTAAPGKTPVPAGAGEIWGMGYGMPSPDPPGSLSPEAGGTAG